LAKYLNQTRQTGRYAVKVKYLDQRKEYDDVIKEEFLNYNARSCLWNIPLKGNIARIDFEVTHWSECKNDS